MDTTTDACCANPAARGRAGTVWSSLSPQLCIAYFDWWLCDRCACCLCHRRSGCVAPTGDRAIDTSACQSQSLIRHQNRRFESTFWIEKCLFFREKTTRTNFRCFRCSCFLCIDNRIRTACGSFSKWSRKPFGPRIISSCHGKFSIGRMLSPS